MAIVTGAGRLKPPGRPRTWDRQFTAGSDLCVRMVKFEVRPKHNHIGIHDQLCATAVQQDLEMAARERLAADRGLLGWYFNILGSLGFLIF